VQKRKEKKRKEKKKVLFFLMIHSDIPNEMVVSKCIYYIMLELGLIFMSTITLGILSMRALQKEFNSNGGSNQLLDSFIQKPIGISVVWTKSKLFCCETQEFDSFRIKSIRARKCFLMSSSVG